MALQNQYPTATSLSGGDILSVWKASDSDTRKASITLLQSYMQANLTFSSVQSVFTTQYSTPVTGFNVTITDSSSDDSNVHLIITPAGTLATGTITMPPFGSVVDKQEVLVNSTQEITTLTVAANGASSVTGAPATMAANDFFRLKYDALMSIWYRVG